MTDASEPPMTAPQNPPFGTFRYQSVDNRLNWSDELFAIFGFAPHEVVPTRALMVSHQHPDDRAGWVQAVDEALTQGRPFSRWHRIIDAGTRVRTLQTGVDVRPAAGEGVELRGIVADLTDRLRVDRDEEVRRAVTRSAQTRAIIDQAKGVLMATMDVDEEQAFELLRWHSSYANLKIRDLATTLVTRLADPDNAGTPPRQRLAAVLAGLIGPRRMPLPDPPAGDWTVQPDVPADRAAAVTSRIPGDLMTRTLVRAVEAAGVSISIADCLAPDWPLVYVNPAFEKLTGYSGADILGRNCRFLQGSEAHSQQSAAIAEALSAGAEIRTVLRNFHRDGRGFWNELHLSAVRDDTGRLTHYIGYQSDVSERIERDQQLEHLAYHDPATGLPNRAGAGRYLEDLMGTAANLRILHIRLTDRPTAGAPPDAGIGRATLSATTAQVTAALPVGTFLARLEDGFLAVVSAMAEVPVAALTAPVCHDGGTIGVIGGVGSADYPADAGDAGALIEAARLASLSTDREPSC